MKTVTLALGLALSAAPFVPGVLYAQQSMPDMPG